MSLISKLTPKTITSQLMLLITVALFLAQIVNLFILVGENRLRAKTYALESSVTKTVHAIKRLPKLTQLKRRHDLHNLQIGNGLFYVSLESRAATTDNKGGVDKYSAEIENALIQNNIKFKSVEVALRAAPGAVMNIESHAADNKQSDNKSGSEGFPPPHGNPHGKKGGNRPFKRIIKDPDLDHLVISVELEPGIWYNSSTPQAKVETLTPRILIATLSLLFITLLSVWFFMRRISRPLSNFANAAENFGRGKNVSPLEEQGPKDIQKAAKAFNKMQRRLKRTLETQHTMLRAVGHDLRTPLTSLRIRSELIPEQSHRDKFIATIDDMTLMTEDILSWAKDTSSIEEVAKIDLQALMNSVVDDFSDQGHNVSIDEFEAVIINIRRLGFKRALTNIISNAIKYAGAAHVSYQETDNTHHIFVDDPGNGIPEGKLAEAVKPFVRLEKSRNKKTGGAGLGLSIAESIIQADGGKLMFSNLKPSGFRVILCIPK